MNKNLLILGAGQYGCVAKEIAESMNFFERIDFLDDHNEIAVGKIAEYEKFKFEYFYAIVAIGNPIVRLDLIQKLEKASFEIATLISSTAYISPSAQIMQGSIIEPMATVQANSIISKGVLISSGAVIRHNAYIEDGCHCDCNTVIMSNVKVPAMTKISCGEIYTAENKN